MERVGFMTYTAASHQGAIKMFWLHFSGRAAHLFFTNNNPFLFFISGKNILFVGHASSLEACTRQIQGLSPQNPKDFVQVVRKVTLSPFYFKHLKCIL